MPFARKMINRRELWDRIIVFKIEIIPKPEPRFEIFMIFDINIYGV